MEDEGVQIGGTAAEALRQFVTRIERLDDEIKALNADKAEIYKQAKGQGFDVKVLRKLIAERRMDKADLESVEQLLDLYRRAVDGTGIATRARTNLRAV